MADNLVELERDIARTREELAGTLRSLTSKLFGSRRRRKLRRLERASAGAAELEHAGAKPGGGSRTSWRGMARTMIGGVIALAVLVPRRLRRSES
jgi:hypothetical protein